MVSSTIASKIRVFLNKACKSSEVLKNYISRDLICRRNLLSSDSEETSKDFFIFYAISTYFSSLKIVIVSNLRRESAKASRPSKKDSVIID